MCLKDGEEGGNVPVVYPHNPLGIIFLPVKIIANGGICIKIMF